jgi:hypothetical protein
VAASDRWNVRKQPHKVAGNKASRTDMAHRGPLEGRRIKVGVFLHGQDTVVAQGVFDPGTEIVLGKDSRSNVVVPDWSGSPLWLISAGRFLNLKRGMHVLMCHDDGSHRLEGSVEELGAMGIKFPVELSVSKLNIRIREGLSVFVHYLPQTT